MGRGWAGFSLKGQNRPTIVISMNLVTPAVPCLLEHNNQFCRFQRVLVFAVDVLPDLEDLWRSIAAVARGSKLCTYRASHDQ